MAPSSRSNRSSTLRKKLKDFRNLRIFILGILLALVGFGVFGRSHFPSYLQGALSLVSSGSSEPDDLDPGIRQFGLKIDKLGILVPVIEGVDGTDRAVYDAALKRGVAHYQGTALPGQGSNIFIFGHSGFVYDKGPYSTIFTRLEELGRDDRVVVYYQGEEFEYSVFWEGIIEVGDLSVLGPTRREQLTLMTCWPAGDNQKRLIIKAMLVD
jgi:LPXTG-site transpeptidase (sortase) family protein